MLSGVVMTLRLCNIFQHALGTEHTSDTHLITGTRELGRPQCNQHSASGKAGAESTGSVDRQATPGQWVWRRAPYVTNCALSCFF